jgi:periplasmic protein TonB
MQRLLPASLLTLALHGVLLSLQLTSRISPKAELPVPLPVRKVVVSLKQPSPAPPQKKIVKELPPPPKITPVERQPLETLPPEQHRIVKPHRQPPAIKPVQRNPLETLPPAQSKIARALPPPPAMIPAALPQPLAPLPPAQERIFRQLPRLPADVTATQPVPKPLAMLPPMSASEENDVLEEQEVVAESSVADSQPVEEIIEETAPVEEAVWSEPRTIRSERRILQQPAEDYVPYVQQATPQRRQQAVSSSSGDQEAAPLYASNPPPNYPIQARRRGLQGVVMLEALIDTSGGVADLRLSSSSGHSILDQAALEAVRGWRFTPGTVSGRRKQMWVNVPVRFALN